MHCAKLLGQHLSAHDFDRQVAEIQIRAAILNDFTAFGIPRAAAVGKIGLGEGDTRPQTHLCSNANLREAGCHRNCSMLASAHRQRLSSMRPLIQFVEPWSEGHQIE